MRILGVETLELMVWENVVVVSKAWSRGDGAFKVK
jgi:hypothetical protein